MYIEKLVAGFGMVSMTLLVWACGNTTMLHFLSVCRAYAHAADLVSTWGN